MQSYLTFFQTWSCPFIMFCLYCVASWLVRVSHEDEMFYYSYFSKHFPQFDIIDNQIATL